MTMVRPSSVRISRFALSLRRSAHRAFSFHGRLCCSRCLGFSNQDRSHKHRFLESECGELGGYRPHPSHRTRFSIFRSELTCVRCNAGIQQPRRLRRQCKGAVARAEPLDPPTQVYIDFEDPDQADAVEAEPPAADRDPSPEAVVAPPALHRIAGSGPARAPLDLDDSQADPMEWLSAEE